MTRKNRINSENREIFGLFGLPALVVLLCFIDAQNPIPERRGQKPVVQIGDYLVGFDFNKDGKIDYALWSASVGTPRVPNGWIQATDEDYKRLQEAYSHKKPLSV